MAQLTLLDLSTNEEIIVPPEGFVFGRVGGDADIQLEDNAISRRQARVSNRQGTWVLEVMVVPPGQRLPRPQALQQGQQFSIGTTEFEVLAIEDEDLAPTVAPPPRSKPAAPAPAAKKPAPAAAASNQRTIPAAPAQKRSAPPPSRQQPPPRQEEDDAPQDDEGDGGESEAPAAGGIGALFVGVPKGIAYYMLNVPKLLVNPLGAVKKTIAELPNAPIGKTGLIGYALPALFISALLPAIGAGIGALIGPGHVFLLGTFLPIVPAISSVIGALIAGFFFHPVFAWIITKLQGESDERSRSNYFLQLMTATLLLSVPNALAAILASIRWVNLLAPVITTAASLVMTYLMYQWLVFFKVHKIIPKVVAVLGLLSAVFTVLGLVGGVQRNLAWSSVNTDVAAEVANTDDAAAAIAAAAAAGAEGNKEAAEALKKAAELQKKALEDAAKAAKATEKAEKGTEKNEKAERAAAEKEKADRAAAEKAEKAEKQHAAEAAKNDPPENAEDAAPSGSYGIFAHKRDAIEKRLEQDPTILASDNDLQKLYGEYLAEVYEIDRKFDKERKSDRTKLYDHLRNAEIFKKASSKVDKLSSKLGVK